MSDDLTFTFAGSDYLAVLVAAVAAFFVGFVWFTLLFGKRWAKEFGMDADGEAPSFKAMAPSMLKDFVGNLLLAYVLLTAIVVWFPALWGEHFGVMAENAPMWQYALWSAGFSWLGYFVPVALSRTGWERRSWGWFGIDTGFHLVKLLAMTFILTAMTSLN